MKADVLNVIPPQRAGNIARQLGMANANERFCQVDFLTYESTARRNIHILGDSIQIAPLMPKSGHMANQQAKVCAAAIIVPAFLMSIFTASSGKDWSVAPENTEPAK